MRVHAILAVAATLLAVSHAQTQTSPCQWGPYDLSPLSGSQFQAVAADGYTYTFSPCANTQQCAAVSKSGSLIQSGNTPFACTHVMAGWSDAQYSQIDPNNVDAGVSILFANGDNCFANGKTDFRTVQMTFPCTPGQLGSTFTIAQSAAPNTCNWNLNFPSSVGCPPSSSKKLSGGSIFLILLAVAIPVYVVFGCLYNRLAKGTATAAESCPNVEFWRALPGYINDGCALTFNTLTCRSRGYSSM